MILPPVSLALLRIVSASIGFMVNGSITRMLTPSMASLSAAFRASNKVTQQPITVTLSLSLLRTTYNTNSPSHNKYVTDRYKLIGLNVKWFLFFKSLSITMKIHFIINSKCTMMWKFTTGVDFTKYTKSPFYVHVNIKMQTTWPYHTQNKNLDVFKILKRKKCNTFVIPIHLKFMQLTINKNIKILNLYRLS